MIVCLFQECHIWVTLLTGLDCVMTEKILAIMFVKTIWEGYEINTDLLTLF